MIYIARFCLVVLLLIIVYPETHTPIFYLILALCAINETAAMQIGYLRSKVNILEKIVESRLNLINSKQRK